jgi:hypothetical protein
MVIVLRSYKLRVLVDKVKVRSCEQGERAAAGAMVSRRNGSPLDGTGLCLSEATPFGFLEAGCFALGGDLPQEG